MQEKRIFTSLLRRIFAAFKENRDLLDKCLGRSRPFIHSEMATFLHFKTDKVLIFPIIFFILSNFSYNTNFHALRVCNSIQRHSFYKFYIYYRLLFTYTTTSSGLRAAVYYSSRSTTRFERRFRRLCGPTYRLLLLILLVQS